MPAFFTRRYQRGKPKRLERFIGGGLLLFAVLLFGLFLLTGGLLDDAVAKVAVLRTLRDFVGMTARPLFDVASENLEPPSPPHWVQVARAMLPDDLDAWQRTDLVVVKMGRQREVLWRESDSKQRLSGTDFAPASLPLDELSPLFDRCRAFGVQAVYCCLYRQAESDADGDGLSVVIVAGEEPADAFGLFKVSRPPNVTTVSVGRAGWLSEFSCAFWAGRYYTEVSHKGLGQHGQEQLARSLVSLQLIHGGPFWADRVLPSEGRVAESLRYIRHASSGIPSLSDCWLAEYSDGVMLGVMRPPAPARDGVLVALGKQVSSGVPADALRTLQDSLGPQAIVGRIEDRLMVVFPAGPYVFVLTGESPVAIGLMAGRVHDRWTASTASRDGGEPAEAAFVAGVARFAEVPGGDLRVPAKIERYTDNLYEKIDGREGMFRSFGFVELRFGRYLEPTQQTAYDVYLFDMGSVPNAFGIYMAERSPEASAFDVGRHGYVSGNSVFFCKGQFYVNVLGPEDSEANALATSKQIAVAIVDTIADTGEPFWAETYLSTADQLPDSLLYDATSALGYAFLERMFRSKYETDGKTYQLFVVRNADVSAARKMFDQFVEATAKYDKVLSREPSEGGETMLSDSLGIYSVAFFKGVYFGGVVECEDRELAMKEAVALRDRLPMEPTRATHRPGVVESRPEPAVANNGEQEEDSSGY